MSRLSTNYYGKRSVRLTKIERTATAHIVYEFTIDITLSGDFQAVYTHGDNSSCIPTDTMKNTVYALAKRTNFDSPEAFASVLAQHFVESFEQVSAALIEIRQTSWNRIVVDGDVHPSAFTKALPVRTCRVALDSGSAAQLFGGIDGLQVIRSQGSAFRGFLKDQYTTLLETDDRLFATSITAVWQYRQADCEYNRIYDQTVERLLAVFANHQSPSVQTTLFEMGSAVLDSVAQIIDIDLTMPNQHHLPVDLSRFGLENDNAVFMGTDAPAGIINGRVVR